jgi:hypothetical protein
MPTTAGTTSLAGTPGIVKTSRKERSPEQEIATAETPEAPTATRTVSTTALTALMMLSVMFLLSLYFCY